MAHLKVTKTRLDGVLLIEPLTNFEDFRGTYVELYNAKEYRAAGITDDFIQDDCSVSYRHVLRGIHGDAETAKLVTCLYGTIYAIIVNNDPSSRQFREWQAFTLSDSNRLQIYLPPLTGNSFLVMSDKSVYQYKQTTTYERSSQFTIQWDDPDFAFYWPVKNPILSERDAGRV